jgi:DNA-binding response OmpR family regulator
VTVTNSDDAMRWLTLHTPTAALIKNNLKPMSGWDLIDRVRSKTSDQYFPIAILESIPVRPIRSTLTRGARRDDVFSEDIGEDEFNRRIQVFFRLKLLTTGSTRPTNA